MSTFSACTHSKQSVCFWVLSKCVAHYEQGDFAEQRQCASVCKARRWRAREEERDEPMDERGRRCARVITLVHRHSRRERERGGRRIFSRSLRDVIALRVIFVMRARASDHKRGFVQKSKNRSNNNYGSRNDRRGFWQTEIDERCDSGPLDILRFLRLSTNPSEGLKNQQ